MPPTAREAIDVRTFLTTDLPGFPAAMVYVSAPIGDPRVDLMLARMAALGLPRTWSSVEGGELTFNMQEAGPGWRLGLSPAGRLLIRGRGQTLADVEATQAPAEWVAAALVERVALVVAGGPVPFVAGPDHTVLEVLEWVCTHDTVSGLMPVVEIPR